MLVMFSITSDILENLKKLENSIKMAWRTPSATNDYGKAALEVRLLKHLADLLMSHNLETSIKATVVPMIL
ncbi:hypothetical protein T10_11191 [Trichinella papuae]|uniref:Uncharacterized protein n=1 Tax=Trichinella papuae TaxID=268474 RepID=A0A0V1MWY8_9BILA|nr:hypothetical protein T10_11191 [Trichinella papuae]